MVFGIRLDLAGKFDQPANQWGHCEVPSPKQSPHGHKGRYSVAVGDGLASAGVTYGAQHPGLQIIAPTNH